MKISRPEIETEKIEHKYASKTINLFPDGNINITIYTPSCPGEAHEDQQVTCSPHESSLHEVTTRVAPS